MSHHYFGGVEVPPLPDVPLLPLVPLPEVPLPLVPDEPLLPDEPLPLVPPAPDEPLPLVPLVPELPLPLLSPAPLPLVPLLPELPLPPEVPPEVPLVPLPPEVPPPLVPPLPEVPPGVVVEGAVLGDVALSAGGVVVPVPPVPVPLVPDVPLVPEVLLGVVVAASLGAVVVVSLFLQAPNMAAITAAVRMIFVAFGNAFIVYSSFTSILCRCLPAIASAGGQQRQVSPAMSLIATPGNGTIREPARLARQPRFSARIRL